MAFTTGLTWLHNGAGLISSTTYGVPGACKTQAQIKADLDDNKIAVIETGGASAILIKPLMLSGGAGTGVGAEASLDVYGVMGFGEPAQNQYDEEPKLLWALGTIDVCDSSTSTPPATASTTAVFTTPGGTEFTSFTGSGDSADVTGDIGQTFAALAAMNTSPPDVGDLEINDVNVGLGIVPGINVFSQIIVSFTIGAVHADSKANALVNLIY
tara:strand:+ start:197 stop:835 length:639 start_codon:yes stop_codon:yes gene_type:complete